MTRSARFRRRLPDRRPGRRERSTAVTVPPQVSASSLAFPVSSKVTEWMCRSRTSPRTKNCFPVIGRSSLNDRHVPEDGHEAFDALVDPLLVEHFRRSRYGRVGDLHHPGGRPSEARFLREKADGGNPLKGDLRPPGTFSFPRGWAWMARSGRGGPSAGRGRAGTLTLDALLHRPGDLHPPSARGKSAHVGAEGHAQNNSRLSGPTCPVSPSVAFSPARTRSRAPPSSPPRPAPWRWPMCRCPRRPGP